LNVSSKPDIALKNSCGVCTAPVDIFWNGIAPSSSRPRVDRASESAIGTPLLFAYATTGPCTVVRYVSSVSGPPFCPLSIPASNIPIAVQTPL